VCRCLVDVLHAASIRYGVCASGAVRWPTSGAPLGSQSLSVVAALRSAGGGGLLRRVAVGLGRSVLTVLIFGPDQCC